MSGSSCLSASCEVNERGNKKAKRKWKISSKL